jgi:uncharacterized protein (DUF302 family)
MSDDGLVTLTSNHRVSRTNERLETSLGAIRIGLFARIDHAASVGMALGPTKLLILGNAKTGSPLM